MRITPIDHLNLFNLFESIRVNDPDFRYFTRYKKIPMLTRGNLFKGNEEYATVGLVDIGDGITGVNKFAFVKGIDRKDQVRYYVEISNHKREEKGCCDENGYEFGKTLLLHAQAIESKNPDVFKIERLRDRPGNDFHFDVVINATSDQDAVNIMMNEIYKPAMDIIIGLGLKEGWLGSMEKCKKKINRALGIIKDAKICDLYPASI